MPDQFSILLDAPVSASTRFPVARLGEYKDKRYGDFTITADDVAEWKKNLPALPGGRALIDEDHLADKPSPHRNTEADGWITGIELDGKQVYGTVDWTPKGEAAVREKRYLFTSPVFGAYKNDAGETFPNTLTGVSLTNKPFLTSMPQIMLASAESIQQALEHDPEATLYQLALDGELGEDAQNFALEQDDEQRNVLLDTLTSKQRQDLSDSDFALPGRKYPIADIAHARNALARVAQNGTPDEQSKVKAAVYRRYPALKPAAKKLGASDRPGHMKLTADILKGIGITDEAAITKLLEMQDDKDVDEAKLLEAVVEATPKQDPPAVKTLEELAAEKGVTILSEDEHKKLTDAAAEADTAKKALEAARTETGTKTLDQLALDAGKVLLDAGQLDTLESAAGKVPGLEIAVKKLSDDAEEARKELAQNTFEAAYDAAVRAGKAAPAQKERFEGFYALDAEGTLKMLEEQPPLVGVKPVGRNVQAPDDAVPAGQHAEHHQLEQQIQAHMAENKTDYFTALEAVTDVKIPGMAGA